MVTDLVSLSDSGDSDFDFRLELVTWMGMGTGNLHRNVDGDFLWGRDGDGINFIHRVTLYFPSLNQQRYTSEVRQRQKIFTTVSTDFIEV